MRNISLPSSFLCLVLLALTLTAASTGPVQASGGQTYYVAAIGNDGGPGTLAQPWHTIQHAVDSISAGDTVLVRGGTYNEAVFINVSGSAVNGVIKLQNYPGETAALDGSGLSSADGDIGISITDQSYITIQGFEIRNYSTTNSNATPMGIFVTGASHHIQLINNHIHHIETHAGANGNAHGLAVYGSSAPASIHDLLIQGNELDHLLLGSSEALAVNGNVEIFTAAKNIVHDNDNIGMVFIGFEGVSPDPAYDQARDGLVSDNVVYNIDTIANPAYGGEQSAGGIYVDGGTRILIERNRVLQSNIGIEVASEHQGRTASYITVQNNLLYHNHTAGLSMGGYDTLRGNARNNKIINNTFFENDTNHDGNGELWLQFDTRDNFIQNNIFIANTQSLLISNPYTQNQNNNVDYNLYFSAAGSANSEWQWKKTAYTGFSPYQTGTGNDAHSLFLSPQLVNAPAANFHLMAGSPVINQANCANAPSTDIDKHTRPQGAGCDMGADEFTAPIFADVPSSHWAWDSIERLYALGLSGGCGLSPLTYCPETSVTRAQMAVFLERSIHGAAYTPPAASGLVFTDVALNHWAVAWIEKLFADGITAGCNPGLFCPSTPVTRDQMAVFLLRAKYGAAYVPPPPSGMFSDVPVSYWAAAWIERLASEKITSGCGAGIFCPYQPVTRAQMSVFLERTFDLSP